MSVNSHEDQLFLNRLTEIVEANCSNERFGVSELAKEAGMSRSRLYLKIKSLTQNSVSRFIREIRLKEARKKLLQTSLTASEVAYEVGFKSPSYFNHCFHEYFGFPPGEAKKYDETESEKEEVFGIPEPERKIGHTKKWLVVIAAVAIILLFSYVFYISFVSKALPGKFDKSVEKSIIVLPFKNLSDEESNQYFADGICEDILTHLSKISDLRVVSRTSSELFRESTLASTEIARQMKVNFLLEGSVRKYENNVRISVQLIDARNDKHLWSENYDRRMADIFGIQSDIAQNVANQLRSVLSANEIKLIEKKYTDNDEAYNLYLEGRFYYRLRTKESFEKSIEYYNKALELDSNYCLAYAGLADIYATASYFNYYPRKESIVNSRTFALKALDINFELAESHATLGGIATYFEYDWDMAEKELKLAIKLDPGYTRAYKLYSEFMDITGNSEEARKYINKALELNSSDRHMYWLSYYYYLKEGAYSKAIGEVDKIRQIDKNDKEVNHLYFQIYLRNNNLARAVEEYKKFMSIASPGIDSGILDSILLQSGKEGIIKFAIKFESPRSINYKLIASYYELINETDSTLYYLEYAYNFGLANLVRIKNEDDFKNLHSDPRFIALLKRMNLADE